jgi:hypothetical protein
MNLRLLFILAILPIILTMCSSENTRIPNPEALYLEEGVTVITTSYNTRTQTTTILYGNAKAHQASGGSPHTSGEDYRLVTWHQTPNPLWFGGNINDHIQRIEILTTSSLPNDALAFNYYIPQGIPTEAPKHQRIAHILNLKPLSFP